MEAKKDRLSLEDDKEKYITEFDLCIVCQELTAESLVKNISLPSTVKLLNAIKERSEYGDETGNYPAKWKRLQKVSAENAFSLHNAAWHRSCYQSVTNKTLIDRMKKRYETKSQQDAPSNNSPKPFLRSQTGQRRDKRKTCFFCDDLGSEDDKLYSVTFNKSDNNKRSKDLKNAIEKSNAERLKVRLSEALDPNDALAIDVMYHHDCWRDNVDHVLRKKEKKDFSENEKASEYSAEIEFFTLLRSLLEDGQKISMKDVQNGYERIRRQCLVPNPEVSRRNLKREITAKFIDVEFHQPTKKNESELLSFKHLRDKLVDKHDDNNNINDNIHVLYKASKILRNAIIACPKWKFTGTFSDFDDKFVPAELQSFFRWLIVGPNKELASVNRESIVNQRVSNLSQKTISLFISDRQRNIKTSGSFRKKRETPEQIAVAVILRQAFRNKKMFEILNRLNVSCNYKYLCNLESRIAAAVMEKVAENNGIFLPPGFIPKRHIFFAADNIDFQEDTQSGKDTLHATAMALYQQVQDADAPVEYLKILPENLDSLTKVPKVFTPILNCNMPKKPRPLQPIYPVMSETMSIIEFEKYNENLRSETCVLFAKSLLRNRMEDKLGFINVDDILAASGVDFETPLPIDVHEEELSCKINSWSSLNSLVLNQRPLTRVGWLPLIASPAHEFQTLLTVLKQAQGINVFVMGESRKTVISMDLGLYHPAKQLQMSRNDLDSIIIRVGELHVEMAMHRTLGSYVEDSGIDTCWEESGIFGEGAVKTILGGKHVKRSVCAHLVTYQALLSFYFYSFFKENKDIYLDIIKCVDELNEACENGDEIEIKKTYDAMQHIFISTCINDRIKLHDDNYKNKPMYVFSRQYMNMVLEMLIFLKAVRDGNWHLHLASLDSFCKYFFAFDKLNYARLIPLYIADMQKVRLTDPDIYNEFISGNWIVNKNQNVSYCCIGADHALEHVNRMMKVSGGLIGITLNSEARNRFFLTAPYMALLAKEAGEELCTNAPNSSKVSHHEASKAFLEKRERDILLLVKTMQLYLNPFEDDEDTLMNFVTKKVVTMQIQKDILNCVNVGTERHRLFLSERIHSNEVNLWSRLPKAQLKTWKTGNATKTIKTSDAKIIELTEDRALFGRMAIISKNRPEFDLKEIIGNYELTVVPRSLFAPDGSLLFCSSKSTLFHCVVDSVKFDSPPLVNSTINIGNSVAIIDAMAEVQCLEKDDKVENCADLAVLFIKRILGKYKTDKYDILYIVFDRYDINNSLKSSTRTRRCGGKSPIRYRICEAMKIKNITIKKLLSHVATKNELTSFFAKKLLDHCIMKNLSVVISFSSECVSSFKDVKHLWNSHEEADTKLILCAKDASVCGAGKIDIYSPDSDVFFLALRRFPELCINTNFVTGKGSEINHIPLKKIHDSLGIDVCNALPGLHALSGADITGSFCGKGKKSWWNAFKTVTKGILNSLGSLGSSHSVDENTLLNIEELVCRVYAIKSEIKTVSELRWMMFKKNQTTSEGLPPTRDALRIAILRTNYQCVVWRNDTVPYPSIPSPAECGWELSDERWVETKMLNLPAPEAIISLIKCNCSISNCKNNVCSCRKARVNCTELCRCGAEEEDCDNHGFKNIDEVVENDDDNDHGND